MESIHIPSFISGFHDEQFGRKMKYNCLGKTGLMVSSLGFGGAYLGSINENTQEEAEGIKTVIEAVRRGINYIDTAPYYGSTRAETILGKALKKIPREAYFLATKVGRYTYDIPTMFDFSYERTINSVDESLRRLNVDYVDIIQVHDIEFAPSVNIIINETLPALQKVKESGKAKFIGITGYPLSKLREVLEKSSIKIDLVLSYTRYTMLDQSLLSYIPYFKSNNLGIVNAAALGMGLFCEKGPADWHPATADIRKACSAAVLYCNEKGVDISKLAAYYSFLLPQVDTHLIGMADMSVLNKNFDTLYNGLTENENLVLEQIIDKFYKPLSQKHWEGIEVKRYWEEINKTVKVKCDETVF